jgi:hypothetical protein
VQQVHVSLSMSIAQAPILQTIAARRGAARVFSILGDGPEQGAVVDSPAIAHQNVGQYAGD